MMQLLQFKKITLFEFLRFYGLADPVTFYPSVLFRRGEGIGRVQKSYRRIGQLNGYTVAK